jgi:hypothetical protein
MGRIDYEKFSLHVDLLVLRIMWCKCKIRMVYYKCDHQGSNAVIVPLYKNLSFLNLRIAKFLDFMVLKDSIVAHTFIKIHELPKFYMC